MRLNIGGGGEVYSDCINLELTRERDNKVDILCDIRKEKLPFKDDSIDEVIFMHVIEHIELKYHRFVLDEIWRVLKPDHRLIMAFPDFIECVKAFLENRYGKRWDLYHWAIFGRQDGTGDYHVSAIERRDITSKLINSGFVNIKWIQDTINATITCYKGEKLDEHL